LLYFWIQIWVKKLNWQNLKKDVLHINCDPGGVNFKPMDEIIIYTHWGIITLNCKGWCWEIQKRIKKITKPTKYKKKKKKRTLKIKKIFNRIIHVIELWNVYLKRW
jgi:hypothetical protein